WDANKQALFEEKVLRLTVSANIPFSWVENPEWVDFCAEFIPQARPISRTTITRRLLPRAIKKVREDVQSKLTGKNATIQGDGWTGINNHHLNAFMATVERTLHTIKVFQDSAERKTAENYLVQLEAVFKTLSDEWKVFVVAVTTDASGESRKARILFGRRHPSVVVLDCYAHQ
ncbi:hypothetical protein B0H11DRAFT_1614038, partial [Mycena galericulata]